MNWLVWLMYMKLHAQGEDIMWGSLYLLYNLSALLCQGSHFSGDMKFHVFSRLFHDKHSEISGQFGFESQCSCW